MPEIEIRFRPGSHVSVTNQREQLSRALMGDLPPMVVKALGVAGASLTERQMTINIVQVHADAFNFADLTVLVTLEPGEGVYGNREEARGQLAEHVLYWLATAQASYPHAMKDMAELDVLLRFAQTAGVCYHIPSATEKSRWG